MEQREMVRLMAEAKKQFGRRDTFRYIQVCNLITTAYATQDTYYVEVAVNKLGFEI